MEDRFLSILAKLIGSMIVSVCFTGGIATNARCGLSRALSYQDLKSFLDFGAATLLLIALSPLMLIVALMVKLSSSGPIIFKQKRLTKDNQVFTIYKFRTMYVGAEKATGVVFAKVADSRVTRVGKYLRKSRLDELPQLLNVIKGEMSLVGPRPERPELVAMLSQELPFFNLRTRVKAGISGLAQVESGYADDIASYQRKLDLDLIYVKKQSLMLDLKITIKTIMVVLTAKGSR